MKEKIRDMVAEVLETDAESIGYDTPYSELDMDSFTSVQLISMIEDEFNITVTDEKIKEFTSVNETVRLIEELRKN